MSKKTRSNIMLLFTAACWGSSFVAQKAGTSLQPFTYNGIRMMIGGLLLIPVTMLFRRFAPVPVSERKSVNKESVIGGIVCGLILTIASNLQQCGIYFDTDAGRAGFITALYIIFVPLIGLFLGKKIRPMVWGCVAMGIVGFYLLTMAGKPTAFQLKTGDFLVLLCAIAYAAHIMAIDRFSPKCDGVLMSCIQFLTTGTISLLLMAVFETPVLSKILDCWLPILYTSLFSSCIAFTLQIIAQRHAEPTAATLIMSTESVFAVFFGVLIARETVTALEALGCAVIFLAVVLAQLPPRPVKA